MVSWRALRRWMRQAQRQTANKVCPLLGVTGLDWTKPWLQSLGSVGLDARSKPFGALCRALTGSGLVGKRSCTSNEISKFLNAFLKTDNSNRVTSHSLKETTLCWAARYGIDENSRLLLGHYELTGSKSLATYSRDMLSRPVLLRNALEHSSGFLQT